MSKQKPRRHENMLADVERWNLELANEIGVVSEVRTDSATSGHRPVLKSTHYSPTRIREADKSSPKHK